MILWWGFRGFHLTQMNSMVHGTHLDVLLCPQTPLKMNSRQFPPKPKKMVQAPGPSLWPSLFPLVGSGCIPLFGVARWIHARCGHGHPLPGRGAGHSFALVLLPGAEKVTSGGPVRKGHVTGLRNDRAASLTLSDNMLWEAPSEGSQVHGLVIVRANL